MMKLEVDGEATVFQAFDQIVLPERAGAIERDRVQLRNQRPQLFHRARLRQRSTVDVIVEIEIVIIHPRGMIEAERRRLQPPAVQGKQVEPCGSMVAKTGEDVVRIGRRRENRQAANIHRSLGSLSVDEGSIQRREPVHDNLLLGGWACACVACPPL